jgi:co-chaperonin GroES (HSP10)
MSDGTYYPIRDRVLIRPLGEIEQKSGLLVLPQVAESQLVRGEVIAVGEGSALRPGDYETNIAAQVGDILYFPRSSGVKILVNGEELLVLPYEHAFLGFRPDRSSLPLTDEEIPF